jgi:hypothetical protein
VRAEVALRGEASRLGGPWGLVRGSVKRLVVVRRAPFSTCVWF